MAAVREGSPKDSFRHVVLKNSWLRPASSDLEDCNYVHYTLQMTLYRYILEEHYGLTVTSQKILHLHDSGATVYDCHYMKDDLLKMLSSR